MSSKRAFLQKGERTAKLSSFAVALIGLTKGAVGLFSGSVALLAQAVDSFTDVFAAFAVFLGLRFAQKDPTEKFPYGYYRAENFASLVIAVLIVISGLQFLWESIMRFLQPEEISHALIALSVAAGSIPFLYVLARQNQRVGEAINSQAVIGQAKNFTIDIYSSIFVFIGILSSFLSIPWVDALVGVIISIFILKTGATLGKDSVLILMDAALKPEQTRRIRKSAEEVKGVINVHDIKIRKSGPFWFGELHMEVEKGLPVEKAHAIAEEVERKAKKDWKELETLVIHTEPAERTKFRIAIPIGSDDGLHSKSKPHFGSAPYFIIVDLDQKTIRDWRVRSNPGAELSKKRGITTADFLIDEEINTLLVGKLGEAPFHVLRDHLVDIYRLPEGHRVNELIGLLLQGALEKLPSPTKTVSISARKE